MITFEYKLRGSRINRADTVKGVGNFLDSKLYFLQHADYKFSQALKLSGLIGVTVFFLLIC
jgi:hypothetical protein